MLSIRRKNLRWVDIDMAEVRLDKLIVHFAQSNRADGKSPKTISWYSEMLDGFKRFLESKGYRAVLSDFDIDMVREFVVHEQERTMSPYTVQGKVRALKAFSSWLFREGHLPLIRQHQCFGVKLCYLVATKCSMKKSRTI